MLSSARPGLNLSVPGAGAPLGMGGPGGWGGPLGRKKWKRPRALEERPSGAGSWILQGWGVGGVAMVGKPGEKVAFEQSLLGGGGVQEWK